MLARKPKTAVYTLIAIALIATVAVGCTFTGGRKKGDPADANLTLYEIGGLTAAISNEYIDQLIVHAGDKLNSDTVLITVYERASAEAADADGYADYGLGWLFSLIRYDRTQYERHLCSDRSGLYFFAKDDDWYYGYSTATDVRFYPRSDNYMAERALWDTLNDRVGPLVRDDFIARNKLTAYSDDTARTEYTYDGEHRFLNFYPYYSVNGSKNDAFVLVLSQPVRQGADGIWCVERMADSYGNVYLWFPDSGMPAKQYYAGLQAECDDGQRPELLETEGAAIAFLDESGYFSSAVIDGSLEEITAPSELIGGSYGAQGQIVIPNNGQDYLTAAREYCEAFEGKHLTATSGSQFCYTYVSCRTEPAEDATAHFREQGEIGENTYAFYLTTIFVPENDQALSHSMAGNTSEYTGSDPAVPEGAYEYYRCGYITLEQDGWHGELVGTGW